MIDEKSRSYGFYVFQILTDILGFQFIVKILVIQPSHRITLKQIHLLIPTTYYL